MKGGKGDAAQKDAKKKNETPMGDDPTSQNESKEIEYNPFLVIKDNIENDDDELVR